MSYGIWKKRGKDWSSFELDGCDLWRWGRMPERKQEKLQAKASKLGLYQPRWYDPSFVVWFVGQRDKGRAVREVNTRSDHALWVAFEDESALQSALNAHGYANHDHLL